MKTLRQGAVTAALALSLAGFAWAAPRVAIITPLGGEVKLGGVPLKTPRIAEEGQTLTVSAGGKVRVQLLGSAKEKVLTGATDYTISRAKLESDAKVVARGSISVSEEIGNISRAGAKTQRGHTPLGLSFTWPPTLQEDRWLAQAVPPLPPVEGEPAKVPPFPISVSLMDLTDPTAKHQMATLDSRVGALSFASNSLIAGHQYRVDVQPDKGEGYSRVFRVLLPEEQEALDAAAQILRTEYGESREMPTLLRLAALYQSFDQTDKVAEVLSEAAKSPQFDQLDETTRAQFLAVLNQTLKSLDLPSYPPKKT